MAAATAPEFVSLSLDQIRPSPMNPRKTFDEQALKQLAASIKEKGVLEPILVRPRTLWQRVCSFVAVQKRILDQDGSGYGLSKPQFERAGITFKNVKQFDTIAEQLVKEGRAEEADARAATYNPGPKALDPIADKDPLGLGIDHYQLIAGERRWRASALAGVETIPALVRNLDEKEAAEVQVIENDQREDVAPLEQAEGYARLIELGDDVESIAAKIGRPARYVTARLTLTKLIPALQEDLRSGKLPFGHAHLLARLPAAQQEAVLSEDNYGGLWDYDDNIISLDQLKQQLRREFIGVLNDAPWDLADESLVPAAGSCTKCPKRSGANPTLFDELVRDDTIDLNKKLKPKDLNPDHCTDRDCYAGKKAAFIELQVKKAEEKSGTTPAKVSDNYYGRTEGVLGKDRYEVVPAKEAKADPTCKPAVVTDGKNLGKTIYIREKKPSTGRSNPSAAKEEAKRREKAKAGNAAAIAACARVAHAAAEIYDRSDKSPTAFANAMREVLKAMCRELWHQELIRVGKRRGIQPPKHNATPGKLLANEANNLDSPGAMFGMIAELIAARLCGGWGSPWAGADRPEDRDFWKLFGVDKAKLVKLAEKGGLKEEADDEDESDEDETPSAKPAKKRKAGAA
ncbi:MAG: ParB/RepB/Spo0J family partition protein [Gemmataceae bacterium]